MHDDVYRVQCLVGHVSEAPRGSLLERRCIERVKDGYLDAFRLPSGECPDCCESHRARLEGELRLCNGFGCPMGEGACEDGCLVRRKLCSILV